MKRKLLSMIVLLMTAATGARAEDYLFLVIDPSDNTTATLMYGDKGSNPYYYGWWMDSNNDAYYGYSDIETLNVDVSCESYDPYYLPSLFLGWSSLTTINNIERLKTNNVYEMHDMFSGCSSLTTLDLSGWDTSNVTNMNEMFAGCSSLTTLNLSSWNTSDVTSMDHTFDGCSSLSTLTLGSGWNTSSVEYMTYTFAGCSSLTTLDLSSWNTSSVTDMYDMFENCSALTTLDLSGWDTSNVETMRYMFIGCSSLTTLTLGSDWSTSNVTDMYEMFSGCSSLTTLDLSGWDTSGIEEMYRMFYNCSSLTSLNINDWDTSSVTDMYGMFYNCSSLTTLDLSNWDTSSVRVTESMFENCSNLETLNIIGWVTSNVIQSKNMFRGCTKLNKSVTAKAEDAGEYWATFYDTKGYNFQAPSGTRVFAVNLSGTALTMTEITDGIVKSSEGVMLKSTSGSITLTPTITATAGDYSDNSLVGTTTAITNPGNAYELNIGAKGLGFYKLGAGAGIAANSAYLTYDGSAGERDFLGFGSDIAVTLIDGEDLSALESYVGLTVNVTYSRSFTNGKASTVCLPFAYTKKRGGGSFYAFTNIEKEGNEYVATMTEPEVSTLTANTPYLYMPTSTGSVDFSGTYEIPASLTAGSYTSNGWTFKGNYEIKTWTTAPTGIYGFSAGNYSEQGIYQGQFVKVGANVSIKPMRCYLENESFAGARGMDCAASADEQLPETIKVRLVNANGEVTAIGSLQTKTGEVTLDSNAWYTLDGRRMEGKPSAKGIYINHNKKVIIK